MTGRVFRSAWFSKTAEKAGISDAELGKAIVQVMAGQADDLGGGVYKKRLAGNRNRSIVLARSGEWWVYEHLFAKQDRANISTAELKAFRELAKTYSRLSSDDVGVLVAARDWIEIVGSSAEKPR